jgi:poly-beta-1,6-N-acetyl-D-glucosamine synthase
MLEAMLSAVSWTSLFLVLYTYVGFFVAAYLVSVFRPKPVRKGDVTPSVSMVIAAYNEERVIRQKIENALRLDYPADKLEIVVAADGSTDRTAQIAREFADRGVKVLHQPGREGKTMALNRAVPHCRGEVLFFSDANTYYGQKTVRLMVRNFHDPSVGGVSGRKIIRKDAGRAATRGEETFWSYEAALKVVETRIGSIATADGEIFAVRRALFEPIPRDIVHDDMYLTLSVIRKGLRVVYEPEAVSEEAASISLKDEFHLKTRYASAGYQIVGAFRDMLIPPRNFFAWLFLSHKLLRWLAPFPLLLLLLCSLGAQSGALRVLLVLQLVFYAMALSAFLFSRFGLSVGPLYFPLYFCMGNSAALYGFFRFLRRGQSTLWRKAER